MQKSVISPHELSPSEAEAVLAFVNSVQSAQQIADRVEFPSEPDIGVAIGQRILEERARLGGSFGSLQQLADALFIGPERFSELVAAITGRARYHESAAPPIGADDMARLRRALQWLDAQGVISPPQVQFIRLEDPAFVAQPLTLLIRVSHGADGTPLRERAISVRSSSGFLTHHRDLQYQAGRVVQMTTDWHGEARVRFDDEQSRQLSSRQIAALQNALGSLDADAPTPAAGSTGFARFAARYLHERHDEFRAAVDSYYETNKARLAAPMLETQWRYEDVIFDVYVHGNDDFRQVAAHSIYRHRFKDWLAPWYRALRQAISAGSQLDQELDAARTFVGDSVFLADHLLTRVHRFIAETRGEAAERIAQTIADQRIRTFLNTSINDLSATTRSSLFPALNSAALAIRASGKGNLGAIVQTRTDFTRQLSDKANVADSNALNNRISALEPKLDQFENDYASFDSRYQTFDNDYRQFATNYATFEVDYPQFQTGLATFQDDRAVVDGKIADFDKDLATLDSQFNKFQGDYTSFDSRYQTFDNDYRQFAANYASFEVDYPRFQTGLATFQDDRAIVDGKIANFDKDLASFDSQFNKFQGDYTSFDSRYQTFDNDYRLFAANYASFEVEYPRFQTGLAEFQDDRAIVDGKIADFNKSVTTFDSQYKTFQGEFANFDARYQTFDKEYRLFTANYTSFEVEYPKFEAGLAEFQADRAIVDGKIADFNKSVTTFDSQYNRFRADYATFNVEVGTVNKQISGLDNNVKKFESEIARINANMTPLIRPRRP